MRTELSACVDKTFGGIHPQDMFKLNEEVSFTKEKGVYLRQITVGLKKYQGFKKSWTDDEVFDRWKNEIKQIVGKNLMKLEVKSSEGNEINYIEGMKKPDTEARGETTSTGGRIFAYQFVITIIKREEKHGDKNGK